MAGHVFTDDEIKQIIDVINTTKHTQYIGQRYVPIFGRKGEDTIEWDNSAPYEPLTIVLYKGNSYTSRQYVPTGADITDGQYWANTGNYNAQIEQYRQDALQAKRRADEAYDIADRTRATADANKGALAAMGVTDTASSAALKKKVDDTAALSKTNEASIAAIGADVAAITDRIDRTKIYNFLNHKDDGADDDARLDYILSLDSAAGRAVYFPAGTYTFRREHALPDGFGVYGEGAATRLVRTDVPDDADGMGACIFRIDGHGHHGYELAGFTFASPTPMPTEVSPDVTRHNIYMLKIAQSGVYDVYLHDITCASYSLLMCGVPHVASSDADRNHHVTVARIRGGAWTTNNIGAHKITTAVIEIYNTDDWRVTDCTLENANYWGGGCGIQCWGGSSVDAETFRGGGAWLHRFAIDNNIIRHTQWSPIYTACAADGYIVNNVCEDCSDGCMSIEGARNVVISGNVLRDSNNYCIALANAMDNVLFCNNVLTQSGETGRRGDQNKPGTKTLKRYRIINRWGLQVHEDTRAHQSLTVSDNIMQYNGDTTVTDSGQSVGTIELGVDSGTLFFNDNQLTNCQLSLFDKPTTGSFGIAESLQLAYLRPTHPRVCDNKIWFDDIDARVGYSGNPFRSAAIYAMPAFAGDVIIRGNEIVSTAYSLDCAPVMCRGIYVSRVAGQEVRTEDKPSNKGLFVIENNRIVNFECVLAASNESATCETDIEYRNNIIRTSTDWTVRQDDTKKVNVFFVDNEKQIIDKTTMNISWIEPLINHLPAKDGALYAMMAVGTTMQFIGAMTLGGKQYHTIVKRQSGLQGCGEVGQIVAEW